MAQALDRSNCGVVTLRGEDKVAVGRFDVPPTGRLRVCYWKQWQRLRTRRRHLISLGIRPDEVIKASRCRHGYWLMSGNGIVQRALTNAWLREQGVPDLRALWIELHYGDRNRKSDPASVNLTGIAWCGPDCQACPAVALAKEDSTRECN